MKKVIAVILSLVLVVAFSTVVNAATITVFNSPAYGIFNFVITEVNDHTLKMTWGYGDNFDRIMIRGKYGAPCDNPPNENTAPTDGYLIYYGNGTEAYDYSVNLDTASETPLYICVWGQRLDGTWALNTNQSNLVLEGLGMTLLTILALVGFLTIISIRSRNILLGLVGSIGWIFLLVYTRDNPINGTTTGSMSDQLIVYLCYIMMVLIPLVVIVRISGDKGMEKKGYVMHDGQAYGQPKGVAESASSLSTMNYEEYRQHVYNKLHPKMRRR